MPKGVQWRVPRCASPINFQAHGRTYGIQNSHGSKKDFNQLKSLIGTDRPDLKEDIIDPLAYVQEEL